MLSGILHFLWVVDSALEEMSNKVSGFPLIFDDFHIVFVSLHQHEYFFLSASTGSIQLIMCCVVVELSYDLYIVC